jgi:hypothetical protein
MRERVRKREKSRGGVFSEWECVRERKKERV